MFDSVGRSRDEEAGRRGVAALLLTMAVAGAVAGAGAAWLGWKAARELVELAEPEEQLIEIVVADLAEDLALPPPPPPPPAAAAAPEEPVQTEPTPDQMAEEVEELDAEVEEQVTSDAVAGVPGGVDGGEEGGDLEHGVIGGVEGGLPGGQLGTGPRTFHHTEVRVRRSVQPDYPAAAYDLDLGAVVCRVRIFIDEGGVPYETRFDAGCPRVFHESARTALLRWRWYPARVDGDKVKAQFLMAIRYVP